MSQELWTQVDKYLCDLLVAADSSLQQTLEASAAAGLPAIQVSPNLGKDRSMNRCLICLALNWYGTHRECEG